MIVEGIILGIVVALGLVFFARWLGGRNEQSAEPGSYTPVVGLAYCNDDQVRPCVVSFGIDANDNTLVNFLLPDLSFPNFYLKIVHEGRDAFYECQRIVAAPNNAYCVGEKMPPGESLHLMLFSKRDDVLLAEGDLSIIGLAFPTMGISTTAPSETMAVTEAPDFTSTVPIGLETPTSSSTLTSTATPPTYPNLSYP
jgi:hypothetical protein